MTQRYSALLAALFASLVLLLIQGRWVILSIMGPLKTASRIAESIAHGNLSEPIVEPTRNDEASALIRSLATMQRDLRNMIDVVRRNAHGVSGMSEQLSHGCHQVADSSQQQSAAAGTMAAAASQMTASIEEITRHAERALSMANQAESLAKNGGQVIHQVVSDMDDIARSAQQSAQVIRTLDLYSPSDREHWYCLFKHAQLQSVKAWMSDPAHGALSLHVRIQRAIRQLILDGALPVGKSLPASRPLAQSLGVSRDTVEAAYSQLHAEGFIERRVGSGSFVSQRARHLPLGRHLWPLLAAGPRLGPHDGFAQQYRARRLRRGVSRSALPRRLRRIADAERAPGACGKPLFPIAFLPNWRSLLMSLEKIGSLSFLELFGFLQ